MTVDCVYVSATWGIHDQRWTDALITLGHNPAVVVVGRDCPLSELGKHVTSIAGDSLPVLAGPLTTVTQHLISQSPFLRVVGLSWGFDLFELIAQRNLDWLPLLAGVIVDSEPTKLITNAAGVDSKAVTFIPWGIDLDSFTPEGTRVDLSSLGLAQNSQVVLSLRAHEELYRVGDILEGFADMADLEPDAVLVIGHSGSLTPTLQARGAELGLENRVRFIGTIAETELAPWLRTAACYVTASEVDGTSVTLLQAMACKTPVVASETPGNLGWVEDGVTGSTFTTGSPASIASALMTVLASNSEASVHRAREQVVTRANWNQNITRLHEALFN